jgi:hypothetical protein
MENKLTKSAKKAIIKDWNSVFPELGTYQDVWLIKRAGPILIGICLDRDSGNDRYRPLIFLHNLCIPFPVIPFTIPQHLKNSKGIEEKIPVIAHKERYKSAAERLEGMSVIPLRGEVTFSKVINIYRQYMEWEKIKNYPTQYTTYKLEGILLIHCWMGEKLEALEEMLSLFTVELKTWPNKALILLGEGGIDGWNTNLKKTIRNKENVIHTVDSEIIKHKLENIPTYPLI